MASRRIVSLIENVITNQNVRPTTAKIVQMSQTGNQIGEVRNLTVFIRYNDLHGAAKRVTFGLMILDFFLEGKRKETG